MLKTLTTILSAIGITSIVSLIGLFAIWLKFPPQLSIETIVDKSKEFNSESKIKIKNIGTLPAYAIQADAEIIKAKIGGLQMIDCGFNNFPPVIAKLMGGESSEISIRPGIGLGNAMHISEFKYILILKYRAKLLFLKKELSRKWEIELRNLNNGYYWDVTII